MDLNTIASLSTAIAVMTGVLFGIIQVRHANRRRKEDRLSDVMSIARTEHISRSIQCVMSFPDEMTEAKLAALGADAIDAVNVLENTFDALGWQIHRRVVLLGDMDSWWGGQIRAIWYKVKPLALERRARKGTNNDFEWTQWLVEQMEKHPAAGKQLGAHAAFRAWKP
jgi:hypothetical protein